MRGKKEKIVGILGGMGPQATVDLMQRIIQLTKALDDIDHIRCIVDNNPKIPSRIKAIIEKNGEDPGPCMADMAKRLETWGADFLAIACNTAHYYYDTVSRAVNIPVINMIDSVLDHVKQNQPDCSKVGILASPAIRITRLYEKKFNSVDIKIVYPDQKYQDILFNVIKDVKAGSIGSSVLESYTDVCHHLKNKEILTAVIACTELSALNAKTSLKTIDAAQILAQKIIDIAKNNSSHIVS
ncbi:MAG: amino acid racemase [Desulfobacula sp.]|uniref:aspartate/glutamate racemase family protein n=1 Tax=Desulfobacula sp. TaxID=2593537 RepID=UPI0025BE2B69|nr:amino acid racemase [Desulfobacula sp.]MCD4721428.1 amino acid racemase [Desulfobacula sp.]